ncbi:hypothetical protein LOS88_21555 [Aeromonas veronii]|uniref:hypothetical protein n=1 Tax=Aeromonas veronii TaxID=654 RepID=UPI001FD1D6CD|nr:hypothetical protein [Aeromonas veronii]MCJ7977190.1 hypothetical protein [Aeromonas veronii]UOR18717.1 hypothetical protein LOS88_21555 [Aeromonas veronii]
MTNKEMTMLACYGNNEINSRDIFSRFYENPDLSRDFMLTRLNTTHLQDLLREEFIKHGPSSLFRHHITCDSILHTGIAVDEVETVILGFIRTLKDVKNLMIIDAFFYSNEEQVLHLFKKMILELSDSLQSITFFTQEPRPKDAKKRSPDAMHNILKSLNPNIRIKDIVTDEIHDRFWLDADNNKGIVMGTSLNGVTKKLTLIDYLQPSDARAVIDIANEISRIQQTKKW